MKIIIACLVVLLFVACDKKTADLPTTIMTVSEKSTQSTLYFNGIIAPKSRFSLVSPIDATILKKQVNYGDEVEKNQLLFVLHSNTLKENYQHALSDYLKIKESYSINNHRWHSAQELQRLGLISRDHFQDEARAHHEVELDFYQKKEKLVTRLKEHGEPEQMKVFEKLSFNDQKTIQRMLQKPHDTLALYATRSGIALFPEKSKEKVNDLQEGDSVKKDQALLIIGDLSGFSIAITINQTHLSLLKLKQKAVITSNAFPNEKLHGVLTRLDYQAKQGDNGVPVFSAQVIIPDVTDRQRAKIHIGMSAQIAIETGKPKQIEIPLNAIVKKENELYVKLIKPDGSIQLQPVTTGMTTLHAVTITSGLKPGDRIVLPAHRTQKH